MATTTATTRARILFEDRRKRRSQDRQKALRYQLAHSKSRGAFDALAVADRQGLSLGAAGDAALCRELAALAPLLARSVFGLPLPASLRGAEVAVRAVRVHRQDLFLVGLGGHAARDAVLDHTASGVRRILQTN